MREFDIAEIAALARRSVVIRDLAWFTVRDRDTGEPQTFGFSTFVRNLSIDVVDAHSGGEVSREFYGIGRGLQIDPIPLVADLTVRTVDVKLSATDAVVNDMLRGYDPRLAPVQLYRVYLDPDTQQALAAAKPRFVGLVDESPIPIPAVGGEAVTTLRCASTTLELTRGNPDVRSHESQLARTDGADHIYRDVGVVGDWQIFWGQAQGTVAA